MSVQVKLLYSFDASGRQFVAKPPSKLPGVVDPATGVGMVALRACLSAILDTSPELVGTTDYTVYTVDYSEPGEPLQGHGRLSALQKDDADHKAIGRMSKSPLFPDLLEIKFRFAPLDSPAAARSASMPLPYVPDVKAFPRAKSTWTAKSPPTIALSPSDLAKIADRRAAAAPRHGMVRKKERRGKYQTSDSSQFGYCRNCGCIETSSWRQVRIPDPNGGDDKVIPLCNACGLWYRNKGSMRPREKWARYKPDLRSDSDLSSELPSSEPPLPTELPRSELSSEPPQPPKVPRSQLPRSELSSSELSSTELPSSELPSSELPSSESLPSSEPDLKAIDIFLPKNAPKCDLPSSPPPQATVEPSTPMRGKENNPTTPGSLDRLFWGEDHGKTPTPGGSRWMLRYFNGDPSEHAKMLDPFLESPCKKRDSPNSSSPPRGTTYSDISSDWTVLPTSPTLGVKRRANATNAK